MAHEGNLFRQIVDLRIEEYLIVSFLSGQQRAAELRTDLVCRLRAGIEILSEPLKE